MLTFFICHPWNTSPPLISSGRAMENTAKTSWLTLRRTGVGVLEQSTAWYRRFLFPVSTLLQAFSIHQLRLFLHFSFKRSKQQNIDCLMVKIWFLPPAWLEQQDAKSLKNKCKCSIKNETLFVMSLMTHGKTWIIKSWVAQCLSGSRYRGRPQQQYTVGGRIPAKIQGRLKLVILLKGAGWIHPEEHRWA